MKIKKEELSQLIHTKIKKHKKKMQLESKIAEIKGELKELNEDYGNNNANNANNANNVQAQEKESIFDAKPGEIIILSFEGVTMKIERQLDDLFKVIDASESQKVKDGDYLKIQGDDVLIPGRQFKFAIIREISPKYETNALIDWRIIRN